MSSGTNQETGQAAPSPGHNSSNGVRESGWVDSSSNHLTTGATETQTPGALYGKTTTLSDDGDEGIDDILCVAIGIYELPSPLDTEALAQLQRAIATLPAPQLRQVFIALVDALPEVPDQVMRVWPPDTEAGTGAKGEGSGRRLCTRCFYTPTPHHHPWE